MCCLCWGETQMTFLQFAYKNVTRNKRAYLAFFLSGAFSVLIFFTFAMFLFHPALKEGYLNNIARKGLTAAEWMIFVFSFLFVLYSVNAFLKSRNKEFGILLMQGITPVRLRKLITAENMIIGVMSIAAGDYRRLHFFKNVLYGRRLYFRNGRGASVHALESARHYGRGISALIFPFIAVHDPFLSDQIR